MATCVGPPDVIAQGSPTVFINGMPAARIGDMTAHGGVIVVGSPNVMIGEAGSGAPGTGGMGGIVAGLAAAIGGTGKGITSVYGRGGAATLPAVKPYDVGTYKELKGRSQPNDGLDIDHQPSKAAQIKAEEAALGRKLTPAEKKEIIDNGPAVAVPMNVHQAGPTYGGKNTSQRVLADSTDLAGAAKRDSAAMVDHASPSQKEIAQKAANWINQQQGDNIA
jgi:hypothetical protein